MQASGDTALAEAAGSALAKISARLPHRVQQQAAHAVSMVYRHEGDRAPEHLALLRRASWDERAVDMVYVDLQDRRSRRRVYPLAVVFLEQRRVLLAWCCLRQDFRKFFLNRMQEVELTPESFRPRRVALLRQYIGPWNWKDGAAPSRGRETGG